VGALGTGQILSWGSTFYLLTVLAGPIAAETGWATAFVVGGVSIALLAAAAVSPAVGNLIGRGHGRRVLAGSAAVLAAGLAALSAATSPALYLLAWTLLGVGMGAGLYGPAFSLLSQLYGESARSAITALTLYGGFASTVCWPLSSFLVGQVGWRWTCAVYAAAHLLITLPLYAAAIPNSPGGGRAAGPRNGDPPPSAGRPARHGGAAAVVLVSGIAVVSTTISTTMSIHMLGFLQALGLSAAAAVLLAAAVGPSQVAARVLEFVSGGRHHPLWTVLAAMFALAAAILALGSTGAASLAVIACYGAGVGLASIGNGAVPLAVFGPERYARLMGRISLVALPAQAAAPLIGTALITGFGERGTLLVLGGWAVAALLMAAELLRRQRGAQRS
jgi:hypothetical protein